jgi:ParB-like chromosome segregation protein Spo0J
VSDTTTATGGPQYRVIQVDDIEIGAMGMENCRTPALGDAALADEAKKILELATSIASVGMLNAPIVQVNSDPDGRVRIILVAGERRIKALRVLHEAAKLQGDSGQEWATVVCQVRPNTNLSDALVANFVENYHRERVHPADMVVAVGKRMAVVGNQTDVAKLLGISQPWVSVLCSLFRGLSKKALLAYRNDLVTRDQATALSKIVNEDGRPDEARQMTALNTILRGGGGEVEAPPRKKERTYRSKADVTALRKALSDADVGANEQWYKALNQFLSWFFMEVDTDEVLTQPTATAALDDDAGVSRRPTRSFGISRVGG